MQLLRADRWPTILLCKVQVFQHFEKITLLLYNKVLKLGKPVSINTAVKLSKRLKPKKKQKNTGSLCSHPSGLGKLSTGLG